MPLAQYAAPKPQRVRLPTIPLAVGQYRMFEPKPTAANFYNPPASGLPAKPAAQSRTAVNPAQSSIDAAQAVAGSTVNYKALLDADPFLKDALDAINLQQGAYQSQLTEQRRRALIQYGLIPDLSLSAENLGGASANLIGNWNADIDATTRELADTATRLGVSTVARENKAYEDATSQYLSSLASRGMIRSGALGQRLNETTLARDQSRSAHLQELTDYMIQLYQNYLAQLDSGNAAKADATREALDRIIAQVQIQQAAEDARAQEIQDAIPNQISGEHQTFVDYPPASPEWDYRPVEFDPYQIPVTPPATAMTGGFINYPTLGAPKTTTAPKRQTKPYYQSFSGPYGYKPLY